MTNVAGPVNAGLRTALANENRAIYLPAISSGYAAFALKPSFASPLPMTPSDLDFLNPANPHFHHPFALYSAGQSNTAIAPKPDMVSQRDRPATLVLGDSGGYQVSTTPGYFTGTAKGKPITIPAGQLPAIVLQNMRWMEQVADYSMVLDFPTGGIGTGKMAEHVERLNANGALDAINAVNRMGLDYNACLEQTKINNDDFVANHAPGATAFLNVLQGRSVKESKFWYEAVKHYPFSGWAFAGHHQDRFSLMLSRLLDMRDDGLLAKAEWIHVLGVSSVSVGVMLTMVQRTVRELYNPTFQMSFDTASPFLSAVNARALAGSTFDERGWASQYIAPTELDPADDPALLIDLFARDMRDRDAKQERDRLLAQTAVGKLLKLGDVRTPDASKPQGYRLTEDGYNLLMLHNVEALVSAHQIAHETFFERATAGRFRNLFPAKDIMIIAGIIETVLKLPTADAHKVIRETAHYLDALRADK